MDQESSAAPEVIKIDFSKYTFKPWQKTAYFDGEKVASVQAESAEECNRLLPTPELLPPGWRIALSSKMPPMRFISSSCTSYEITG